MNIKEILKTYNVENVELIENALKSELHKEFIPKVQYNKKVQMLDDLQEKLNDFEARGNKTNEFEEKYKALEEEFANYKNNIEVEKTTATKKNALVEALTNEGFNKKIIGLLENKFDLNNIEIEDNKIKDWDNLVSPFKSEFGEFIANEVTEGLAPNNPPIQRQESIFTREQISQMSAEEINANWDNISKSLENM